MVTGFKTQSLTGFYHWLYQATSRNGEQAIAGKIPKTSTKLSMHIK